MEWEKREKKYKPSESIVQTKTQEGLGRRQALTGYDSLKSKREKPTESLRMENSYGSIAFGGNRRNEMTIVVSEKRRHNQHGITGREKRLQESRQIQRPVSRGRVLMNNGSASSGVIAFQCQAGMTRQGMVGLMTRYIKDHEQKTLCQVMPFMDEKLNRSLLAAMKDLEEKKEKGFKRGIPRLSAILEEIRKSADEADETGETDEADEADEWSAEAPEAEVDPETEK